MKNTVPEIAATGRRTGIVVNQHPHTEEHDFVDARGAKGKLLISMPFKKPVFVYNDFGTVEDESIYDE